MKAILGSVYCGNIEYYSVLKNAEEILIDPYEHYSKQSYRSRCEIYGANGKLNLTIPLIRRGKRIPMKDALIDNSQDWQKLHWKSIESAYRSSPYFEFYEHHFISFYQKEYTSLYQFNTEVQDKIISILGLDISISESTSYEKEYADVIDFRESIHPKKPPQKQTPATKYIQVFDSKYGFIPNLSILDLLFNEGPNTISFL